MAILLDGGAVADIIFIYGASSALFGFSYSPKSRYEIITLSRTIGEASRTDKQDPIPRSVVSNKQSFSC